MLLALLLRGFFELLLLGQLFLGVLGFLGGFAADLLVALLVDLVLLRLACALLGDFGTELVEPLCPLRVGEWSNLFSRFGEVSMLTEDELANASI